MEDKKLIKKLKRNDEDALERIIRLYTGYVSTVIANQLGGFSDTEAIEELTSDVFFALWRSRLKLSSYHLRGWLGTTARNKAKNYLRTSAEPCEALDEDYILFSEDNLFMSLERQEQHIAINRALSYLRPEESEVIIRYYYYNQTVSQIAEEAKMNRETAKSRLQRGRAKLKTALEKGGYLS